jgi:NitT/TauT family transport system substrate-binding protein
VTSEPYAIEKETGVKPAVFLLADYGYASYSTTIEAMRPWYESHEDVAKRFVEASIIGWYTYLYGDNSAANALILKDNPDMDQARIDNAVAEMKAYQLLVSGDAATGGIGCMTTERWQRFYAELSAAGVVAKGLDVSAAFTTALVCHGLGMDLVQ